MCLLSENDVLEYMGKRAAPHLLTGNRSDSSMATDGSEVALTCHLQSTWKLWSGRVSNAFYHRM